MEHKVMNWSLSILVGLCMRESHHYCCQCKSLCALAQMPFFSSGFWRQITFVSILKMFLGMATVFYTELKSHSTPLKLLEILMTTHFPKHCVGFSFNKRLMWTYPPATSNSGKWTKRIVTVTPACQSCVFSLESTWEFSTPTATASKRPPHGLCDAGYSLSIQRFGMIGSARHRWTGKFRLWNGIRWPMLKRSPHSRR